MFHTDCSSESVKDFVGFCFVSMTDFIVLQALAELCEIKFGKTHPVCNLVSFVGAYEFKSVRFCSSVVILSVCVYF